MRSHKKSSERGGETSETRETSETSEETTLRKFDVLLGRGNHIAFWIGNNSFRRITVSYEAAYRNASRLEKLIVSKQVIEEVHDRGGLFVEMNPSGDFIEVSPVKALEKTRQCLRKKSVATPEKCSKTKPAAEEEIPALRTSSTSSAKRKGACSPLHHNKRAKKALPSPAVAVAVADHLGSDPCSSISWGLREAPCPMLEIYPLPGTIVRTCRPLT
jgi:hypothetical protein